MKRSITPARAVTAIFMRRILKIATIAAAAAMGVVILIAGTLAYFFSGWWWLIVLPFGILFGLFVLARVVALLIVNAIYSHKLSSTQKDRVNEFIDKIQATLEARATPLPLIALICIKDILIHRDIVTLKKIVQDTANLRSDYTELEKLFT